MSEPLTFMMGKFPAPLLADRRYCKNHMWCLSTDNVLRFGFTTYAVRLMQDVYFLEWEISEGDSITLKQKIGHIETSKAMSDLFAPVAGTLVCFNPALLNDPSVINVDMYGNGWLFEIAGANHTTDTLSMNDYHAFLEAGWEKTQNMLKGHM